MVLPADSRSLDVAVFVARFTFANNSLRMRNKTLYECEQNLAKCVFTLRIKIKSSVVLSYRAAPVRT